MKIELDDRQAEFLMRTLLLNYAEDDQDFESDISDHGISGLIIGKLCQADFKMYDVYSTVRNMKWKNTGRITKYLFMGAGWHSLVAKNKLHRRIDQAVSALGGMQQNGGMGTEFDDESDKKDKQTLKEVALDVLTAFGLTVDDLK